MRYVSNFRNGQWDDGCLTDQATITMSECACVLQYAQTCFEGLKAYTTEDGRIPPSNIAAAADNTEITDLTLEQLYAIFSGSVTKFSELSK